MADYYVLLITASNFKEAEKISKALVGEKLAACVNIIGKIRSRYWWKGKIETAPESLLIVKTKKALFSKCMQKVKKIHSYAVPEVIALPIAQGNSAYLNWIGNSI